MPGPFLRCTLSAAGVAVALHFATAFAPASIGNVAVGFDVLGQSFPVLGDRVRAELSSMRGVRIAAISGLAGDLPREPEQNTAGRAVQSLLAATGIGSGIALSIEKGIPLGSGLGGSAASAVAAVVAANELLGRPCSRAELLAHAVAGETVASGSRHADNVSPALFGGLVVTVGVDPPQVQNIPVPTAVRCVVVHPKMFLSTRESRGILRPEVRLEDAIRQLANLAGLIAGCHANDLGLIRASLEDVLIEPQRAGLIPGFAEVKAAALAGGALGCSISGAGPSVFAWCEEGTARAVADGMTAAFARHALDATAHVAPVGVDGARILDRG